MDIKSSIVAILNTENEIVGTGFVAADCLIVTCAHVIEQAKSAPSGMVRVRFAADNSERFADVEASAYSSKDELDVAILRASQMPRGVQPLRMAASAGCPGHEFFATGYPQMGAFESLSARGEIISLEKDKRGDPYLQLRSQEVTHGMSGGPVMDTVREVVVGMVNGGFMLRADKKYRDTALATPCETLWQVCAELEPSETCPYLGLETFTPETAQFFFGREALTGKLVSTLRGGCRFLAVFGPSGSGKSSLVRAGLLPCRRCSPQ